ncbi:hypothetical protein FACS189420_6190 [Bacteroidia bacterium]|nr:hypothetical protein FACS189420_6190 [Bacteroidia bacterium]
MAELNLVETTVSVSGNQVHFSRLSLYQQFNAHHRFEVEVDYEEFGGKWMDNPVKQINFIGQDVNITMKHRQTGETNLFAGIITNVSFSGYHGQQNSIVITGCSPTIKLAGQPAMDSFMDLPLQQIVQEAVGNSGNGAAVTANPKFGSKLDYVCQYNENCFDFLNRLSWQFGEWFFYDGQTTYFGMKQGKGATLEYDKEMTYFDLSANLSPQKFNRYQYLHHDDKEIDEDDPSDVPGVRGYLQVSKGRSESIYTSDVTAPLIPDINTKKDLNDLVKAEKSRAVGSMLVMRGKTQTCKVKIGGTVKIKLPEKMDIPIKSVDTFLVTQVTHMVDQEGHYSNSFEGIIDGIEAIPMAEPRIPIANPQIATVKEDVEPRERGLVKVQFQWQTPKNKTSNWIRVQTPDAGKSDIVPKNRGFVFIPEKDDIVMVGFEYGNPDRPFVMGSIFSEKVSKGGGVDNNIKTIITRSGHTIKFDDTKGKEKIQIYDIKKNIVEIDTVADTINISANSTINLSAVNINLIAKNAITETAGVTFTASAGVTSSITGGISTFINAGKDAAIKAGKTLSAKGGKNALISSGVNSQMSLDSKGNAKIQGKKKVDVFSKEKINIAGDKETKIAAKDMKIQGKTNTSIKGRKVDIG